MARFSDAQPADFRTSRDVQLSLAAQPASVLDQGSGKERSCPFVASLLAFRHTVRSLHVSTRNELAFSPRPFHSSIRHILDRSGFPTRYDKPASAQLRASCAQNQERALSALTFSRCSSLSPFCPSGDVWSLQRGTMAEEKDLAGGSLDTSQTAS